MLPWSYLIFFLQCVVKMGHKLAHRDFNMFDMQLVLLSIPLQATPSPLSPPPAPTLLSCSTHLSSSIAGVWRQCSGSGRSGRRCGGRKRSMGCPRCTSPGLSPLTWATTSAWRRAPRRKPSFMSTWKVDKLNCQCLSAFTCVWVCVVFVCERAERELISRARGNCCLSLQWQGALCVGVFVEKVFVTLPRTGTVDTVAIYWVHYLVICILSSMWLHIPLARCHLFRLISWADHNPNIYFWGNKHLLLFIQEAQM